MNNIKLILIFSMFLVLISCGKKKAEQIKTPEAIYTEAMEYFEKKNYFKAKQKLDVIKLQYPASEFAELAQYYLGECEYYEGNYIIAAFNYNNLRRIYPTTKFAKESMFKAAKSYFKLSPSFERDQEYTLKAIESLQEFQYVYPGDSLTTEAGNLITELRDKLGHRQYKIAEIYMKLEAPRAAVIYFDEVLNNYDDTKYYEDAFYGKISALKFMKKYEEAKSIIDIYLRRFAKGKYIKEVEQLKAEVQNLSSNE